MKITKTRLREIIKEELEHAISEQRPPLPPPPPRSKAAKPTRRPPPPPKKGGSAGVEQGKTYNRFASLLMKTLKRGLGPEASERDIAEAALFFLNEAGANLRTGGRRPEKQVSQYLDGLDDREATNVLRSAFAKASKGMKAYKQQADARKQKFQQARLKEGPQRAWCVGYEKDGETKHETVHADAAGIAERKIKRKHDVRDKAIKSTREGKCKGHA